MSSRICHTSATAGDRLSKLKKAPDSDDLGFILTLNIFLLVCV